MPIRETSFRIGCGRYMQEPNALLKCGEELRRLGRAPLIVGGPRALNAAGEEWKSGLSACAKSEIRVHAGTCNDEDAQALAAYAQNNGFDVIVGIGGGVIMDFAKLIAHFAELPVLNVPTSSATCAAYTPLSVRYTREGRTVGTMHFENELDGVLVDSNVLLAQPPRLFLAGTFDALAKFVEIKQRFDETVLDYPLGLDWAYTLAKRSFSVLVADTENCLNDMAAGKLTDTVQRVCFTQIAATGVISGIARGSNQCALAHKFYESSRKLFFEPCRPYLHGEIVGVGLLLQNAFNGEEENNAFLLSLMNKYGMPASVRGIGLKASREEKALYFDALKNSSAIDAGGPEETERLREALDKLFSL